MLRPTFNWLSMLRRLWPRLKISGARHKVHSERERHTLIPDPCLGELVSHCGDILRVLSRVPRLRTSAWAGYDRRALQTKKDVKMVSPISTIDTQIIKCVFYPGEPDLVLWCQRTRDTIWQETHHTADDLKVPDHSLGREKRKGYPDCAIILFGIIRQCEHNFHPFPEKSTASITCTFC